MKALVYPTSDSPKITIRHLLSHAEGFPEDNPWGDQQLAETDEQLSAMITAGIPFSNAPGIAYEYSNFGFAILGRIVANVGRGHAQRDASPTAAYTAVRDRARPEAARHDVDDARAVARAARSARARLSLGGRRSGRTSRCSPTDRSARWAAC